MNWDVKLAIIKTGLNLLCVIRNMLNLLRTEVALKVHTKLFSEVYQVTAITQSEDLKSTIMMMIVMMMLMNCFVV